jgi:hypothetical protein
VLHLQGLKEDLPQATFDLVMADRKTPLLSIGQLNLEMTYGDTVAIVTIVFCPELPGLLLSCFDCKALDILHRDYPLSISRQQTVASVPLLGGPMPDNPTETEKAAIKEAILTSLADVFDQSTLCHAFA